MEYGGGTDCEEIFAGCKISTGHTTTK
jgi:hypothetical protein